MERPFRRVEATTHKNPSRMKVSGLSWMFSILLTAYIAFLGGLHHSNVIQNSHQHGTLANTFSNYKVSVVEAPTEEERDKDGYEIREVEGETVTGAFDTTCSKIVQNATIELKRQIVELEHELAHRKSNKECHCDCASARPASSLGELGTGKPGSVIEGLNFGRAARVSAFALHESLLPNLPPRKENNPKSALVLTHNGPRKEMLPVHDSSARALSRTKEEELEVVLSACDEVNVVISKGDGRVCLAVMESYDVPPYHVLRLRRNGKRINPSPVTTASEKVPAIGGAESREDEGAAAWAAKRRL